MKKINSIRWLLLAACCLVLAPAGFSALAQDKPAPGREKKQLSLGDCIMIAAENNRQDILHKPIIVFKWIKVNLVLALKQVRCSAFKSNKNEI